MTANPSDILLTYSSDIGRRVADSIGGRSVRSIFVTGSAARGEIASYRNGSTLEIYSDVDLYVVVNDGLPIDALRERARSVAAGIGREGDGFRIVSAPDVGVFAMSELGRMAVRPGTVDIAASHRMILGDAGVPASVDAGSAADIDASEALYLLENRLTEAGDVMDRLDEGGVAERYAFYVWLKNGLDAVSALLIALGRYSPSREERMTVLRELNRRERLATWIPKGAIDWIEYCHESLGNLQQALPDGVKRLDVTAHAVTGLLVDLWKRIAERIYAATDWAGLVGVRGAGAGRFRNGRELIVLAKRLSVSRFAAALRAGRLARFSPREALRLAGLVEGLQRRDAADVEFGRVERAYAPVVGELTRLFGYRDGTLYQRARRMYRAIV